MKKLLFVCLTLSSLSVLAAGPEINQLTKKEIEEVGNEFAVNFSHTAVAAPETDDPWGVELGLIAGQTGSPKLKDVVDASGEDGSNFKNIYTAGLMARVHFPMDLFIEASMLPKKDISDVEVSNLTYAVGWNVGAFLGLPVDLAVGADFSDSDIKFDTVINNSSTSGDVNTVVKLNSKSRVLWVGASKTFIFFTPYIKVGTATTNSDVDADSSTGTIFSYTSSQSESVSSSGSYLAAGANLQFFLFRLGFEASQTIGVKRMAAKFSLAF